MTARGILQLLQDPIQIERRRFLAGRKLSEGLALLHDQCLRRDDEENVIYEPVPVCVRVLIRSLKGILTQVE